MSVALREIEQTYGINQSDIRILDGQPWLSSEQLTVIARKSGDFSSIEVEYQLFDSALKQLIYSIQVVDRDGRIYRRTGVATMGEKLPTGAEVSEHDLAASRALRSTLAMAGFDVLKAGSIVKPQGQNRIVVTEMDTRYSQLRQIHTLAEKLGLIQPATEGGKRDLSKYKAFLLEKYGVESTAGMNESERASVIAALTQMEREYAEL